MPLFTLGSDLNYDVWTKEMDLLAMQGIVIDVSKVGSIKILAQWVKTGNNTTLSDYCKSSRPIKQ